MYFNDAYARTVRLPVRYESDSKWWTLLDGSDLPEIKDGAIGEIVLDAYLIVDDEVRIELSQESKVPFLPQGTTLWARVDTKETPSELMKFAEVKKCDPPEPPGRFVAIMLTSDLGLHLRANKSAMLGGCECSIPGLPEVEATSVNHAYTMISTHFEPARRSHSGNVFLKVYYEDESHGMTVLRPLKDKRVEVEGKYSFSKTSDLPQHESPENESNDLFS